MSRKLEITIFILIVTIATFFSTYKLSESPGVWYDEGMYIQAASNLADGHGANFQFAPGDISPIPTVTVGYPVIYPLALLFKIFGTDILVARGMMVFFILSLIILVYFLVRKRYGPVITLSSMALIATFPPLYGNGKSVLGEVPALLFLTLSLIFVRWAILAPSPNPHKRWIILAGFCAGICAAAKLIFLLFLPAFALVIFVNWRRKKLDGMDVILAGFFSFIPVGVWFFVQYYGVVSMNTILKFYANPLGAPSLLVVVKDNLINFVTEAGPLYLLLMILVWLVSVVIRKKKKIIISAEEWTAIVFSLLVFLAYLRIVGWHRYLFPAQIVAMFYFVPALTVCFHWISDLIHNRLPATSIHIKRWGTICIVVALCVWGVYGVMFNSWVANSYTSHKTAFWLNYFREVSPDKSIFFYDVPEVAIFDLHRNYYQYMPLSAAGGPYGSQWLKVIEKGIVDQIIVRTDTLEGNKEWFTNKYHPVLRPYKYTILDVSKPLSTQ